MKKIINGKKYDTDTAEYMLGYVSDSGDLAYTKEDLYRKKNGEYFIVGEGGPKSKYRIVRYEGCYYSGGPNVIPISESQAKEFVEIHGVAEEYERIFGKVEE